MSSSSFGTPVVSQSVDDPIMERWKAFFSANDRVPKELKSVYAMGKLVQVAVVQYMRLRGVCEENLFVKRHYKGYNFFTLNMNMEEGVKLDGIIKTAGSFITSSSLKAFRLQLLHDPENPEEIGEELSFLLYYGIDMRVHMDFGNNDSVELDMSDCSFGSFVHCFAEILGKIRCYCSHLSPLPKCEKRFRTSFYKKLLPGTDTGAYGHVAGKVHYASNIQSRDVGVARTPGVASAAILRTCYCSSKDIDDLINEEVSPMVQNEKNNILNQGQRDSPLKVFRESHQFDGLSYHDIALNSQSSPIQISPDKVPRSLAVEIPLIAAENPQVESLLSPGYSHSLSSFEAIVSPFPSHLVHENNLQTEITCIGSVSSKEESERDDDKDLESHSQTQSSGGVNVKKSKQNKGQKKKKKTESSEDDVYIDRRKTTTKRKLSDRHGAIDNKSSSRAKRRL